MIRAILTDIEGTTSSLSFVKDVLFPYARAHIAAFVRSHAGDLEVRECLDEVSRLAGKLLSDEEAIETLIFWIDQDRKITPLKTLQGLIWEAGYRSGDFHGHVYPDAVAKLQQWKAQGVFLYVYSSGSVHAQKLLFSHTEYGDLSALFAGFFDTRVGAKQETDSYRAIAGQIGLPSEEILFLSDIGEELEAARAAGMKTCQLLRAGAKDCKKCPKAGDFSDINLQDFAD